MTRSPYLYAALVGCLFMQACATRITESPSEVLAPECPFESFERVLLVSAELAEPCAGVWI